MSIKLVTTTDYTGTSGIAILGALQAELSEALKQEDWRRVRHLDAICALVIERVIDANRADKVSVHFPKTPSKLMHRTAVNILQ